MGQTGFIWSAVLNIKQVSDCLRKAVPILYRDTELTAKRAKLTSLAQDWLGTVAGFASLASLGNNMTLNKALTGVCSGRELDPWWQLHIAFRKHVCCFPYVCGATLRGPPRRKWANAYP